MGRRGPLPKSRKEREATGNPSRRPLPAAPAPLPPVVAAAPERPEDLSREADEEWRRVVPLLAEADRLSSLDRAVLVMYCETWGDCVRARRELNTAGWTVESAGGQQYPHPQVKILLSQQRQCAALAAQLGLTPAARLRLPLPASAESQQASGGLQGFAASRGD